MDERIKSILKAAVTAENVEQFELLKTLHNVTESDIVSAENEENELLKNIGIIHDSVKDESVMFSFKKYFQMKKDGNENPLLTSIEVTNDGLSNTKVYRFFKRNGEESYCAFGMDIAGDMEAIHGIDIHSEINNLAINEINTQYLYSKS